MKNLKDNAMMQEMSLQDMKDVNGGIVPLLATFLWGFAEGSAIGIALVPTLWELRNNSQNRYYSIMEEVY